MVAYNMDVVCVSHHICAYVNWFIITSYTVVYI